MSLSLFSSTIVFQEKVLGYLADHLPDLKNSSQIVLFSHPRLMQLYGPALLSSLKDLKKPIIELMIPEGEKFKSLTIARRCWQRMSSCNVDRKAVVIAFGGGVVCDLAGFVASCYMRGLDTVYLPSTLLAMVDAAIGGKTGVNLPHAKNAIGTFHQPKHVLIDISFLSTLADREYQSGIAEIIKYGMIADCRLVEELEEGMNAVMKREGAILKKIIERCVMIKCRVVEKDEKDLLGKRAELNYGHTFGHAIEAAEGFSRYLHGEAVAIGMSCAAALSARLGLCAPLTSLRQDNLCSLAMLPIRHSGLSINRLMALMGRDKKGDCGKINLILLEEIGKTVKISDADPHLIRQVLLDKMEPFVG